MPSFFKRSRATSAAVGADSKPQTTKKKSHAEELKSAFSGDEGLLQLHEETAELLKRMKSPVAKSPSAFAIMRQKTKHASPSASINALTPSKVRMTIEVLDDDDDDEAQTPVASSSVADTANIAVTMHQPSPGAPSHRSSGDNSDPFAFSAEEARVRKASDTFYPDTSPSKKAMDRQLHALTHEQRRLEGLDRSEQLQGERRRQEIEHHQLHKLQSRLETSAVKVKPRQQISP